MSHKRSSEAGVHFIHQVYGLYRDGTAMSSLFYLSSEAWQSYASRNLIPYKLWTADEVDTLVQLEAPEWLQALYRDVRLAVQRADVARFFILFKFGGLYADLNVFPNLEKFPLVPLGLCKMRPINRKPQWAFDVVVAKAGNECILKILEDMSTAMALYTKNRKCHAALYTTQLGRCG